jgi:hypothetical protein
MARKEKPTGAEIAEKAKGMKLDKDKSCQAQRRGKDLRFTMADLSQVTSEADLERGVVVGQLVSEFDGDETDLKAGTYSLFVAKVGDKWEMYAESGGQVKAAAKRVRFDKIKPGEHPDMKPEFHNEGWCIFIPLILIGIPVFIWHCW